MAITFTKEPSGIYPAYNDSYVVFQSSLADNERAELSFLPSSIFTRVFLIYPDSAGNYVFNLKEIAKTIFNEDGFKDSNFFDDAYYKNIDGLYLLQSVTIEVFNSSGAKESLTKSYEFFKSLKQVEEEVYSNNYQLLSASNNGIDHYITYFEGFPFNVDIQRVTLDEVVKVVNAYSSAETIDMVSIGTSAFRLNIDRSDGDNWTASNFLPLITGLNNLEVFIDGNFKTNLYLKKKKVCKGIYLKWFNSDGGFSYYLFDKFFTEELKGKDIAFVESGEFLNVGELNSTIRSIGKRTGRRYKISVKCDENEVKVLKSLYTSPFVQLYTSVNENVKGSFINVGINGSFNYANKIFNNKFSINVVLPEMITAKL